MNNGWEAVINVFPDGMFLNSYCPWASVCATSFHARTIASAIGLLGLLLSRTTPVIRPLSAVIGVWHVILHSATVAPTLNWPTLIPGNPEQYC